MSFSGVRTTACGALIGTALVLSGCAPALPTPRGVAALDGVAPRSVDFVYAYENRRNEPYAPLVRPSAVTVLPDGQFLLADFGAGRLHVFDHEGYYDSEADAADLLPLDLGSYGFLVYVLDAGSRTVVRFTEQGIFRDVLLDIGSLDPGSNVDPSAMAVDRDGRLAVCDIAGHRVLLTGPFLNLETIVGEYGSFNGQFNEPRGAAFGNRGHLYVSERGNRRVQVFDRTGQPVASTASLGGTNDLFVAPSGMATDRHGNVYVTDTVAGQVVVLAPDLYPIMVVGGDDFGPGSLRSPIDCAVSDTNQLFVVDAGAQALLVYDIEFP